MRWLRRILGRKRRVGPARQPFPRTWLGILDRKVPCYPMLPPDDQRILRECVQTFIAEKQFIGHGDLKITDEIRVCVAGNACVLLIGIPQLGVFPRLREIIVHARNFGEVVEAVGPDGRRYEIHDRRAGEAWRRGPVVLAWDAVRQSVASPRDGFNVVYHEFAHVLDLLDGAVQGTPPLGSKQRYAEWSRVFNAEYERFLEALRGRRSSSSLRRGRPTFIDPYGAKGPEEFFAVVTEHFFEQPREFLADHPELYKQLQGFYRQDPANWGRGSSGGEVRANGRRC